MSPIGVIAASIIGLLAAYLTLVVTRGTKVSELRQEWINAQRDDLAILVRASLALSGQRAEDDKKERAAFDEAAFRISLRRKPAEQIGRIPWKRKPDDYAWDDVAGAIDDIRYQLDGINDVATVTRAVDRIRGKSRIALKLEWNKVRNGEPGYQAALLFVGVPLAALALIAYYAVRAPTVPDKIQLLGGRIGVDAIVVNPGRKLETPAVDARRGGVRQLPPPAIEGE